MTDAPLLRPGARGEAVRKLREGLRRAGFACGPGDEYDAPAEEAVRAFQAQRRLRVDGICGPETWGALEESRFSLGDRLLCARTPMIRGDDVVDLQCRLDALGYDAGRTDGIFGPQTEAALVAFQRDAGIAVDRICGPETIAALGRLGTPAAASVAATRERDRLRRETTLLRGARLFVAGDVPSEFTTAIAAALTSRGANVVVGESGDPGEVAVRANSTDTAYVLYLTESEQNLTQCAYFANAVTRSEAGYRIAVGIGAALGGLGLDVADPEGRTSRVLRETRMPAVVCELSDPSLLGLPEAVAEGIRVAIESDDAP